MAADPEARVEQMDAERRPRGWWLVVGAVVLAIVLIGGYSMGGEPAAFVAQSVRALPFVPLAVLAYYGLHYRWARVLAVIWLVSLVLGMALAATGSAVMAVAGDEAAGSSAGLGRLTLTVVGMLAAGLVGFLGFLRPVRQWASRVLPLDPDSFVHTVALVAVVTLALESFVPLIVTGEPTLIAVVSEALSGGAEVSSTEPGAALRGEVYGLVWLVCGAVLAVGFGVRRSLSSALRRLGLVRPTSAQVLLGVGSGVGLVLAVAMLGVGIDWLWGRMGWPVTGGAGFDEAFGTLLAPFLTPVGALVLGLSAGLGEELAVRGVLQPRLGIFLSNLLFTGLHAFQYNWDSLLVVFLLGTALGLIRRRTNTTTSVIVHGVYDFILVLAMMAQLPLVGQ